MQSFTDKIVDFLDCVEKNPTFYTEVDYDRAYYLNYLDDGTFITELKPLITDLKRFINQGFDELTMDIV